MNYTALAWMFAAIAALFALGLTPEFARWFYPGTPDFRHRLAAPVIFGLLAAPCFTGLAMPVLALTAALGLCRSLWLAGGIRRLTTLRDMAEQQVCEVEARCVESIIDHAWPG